MAVGRNRRWFGVMLFWRWLSHRRPRRRPLSRPRGGCGMCLVQGLGVEWEMPCLGIYLGLGSRCCCCCGEA